MTMSVDFIMWRRRRIEGATKLNSTRTVHHFVHATRVYQSPKRPSPAKARVTGLTTAIVDQTRGEARRRFFEIGHRLQERRPIGAYSH
jgi:hypothetical protein